MKDTEDNVIDRAIKKLINRAIFRKSEHEYEISSLIPIKDWRPIEETWWKKKEACVIGKDPYGNLFLRVCDGTVRFWNRETQEDEIIAPSVRSFIYSLSFLRNQD